VLGADVEILRRRDVEPRERRQAEPLAHNRDEPRRRTRHRACPEPARADVVADAGLEPGAQHRQHDVAVHAGTEQHPRLRRRGVRRQRIVGVVVVDAARDRADTLRPEAADRRRVTQLVDQRAGLANSARERGHHCERSSGCHHLLFEPGHRRFPVHPLEQIARSVEVTLDERGFAERALHQTLQLRA
jgi:hypothetical protein